MNADIAPLQARLVAALDRHDSLAIAVSGGVDSMVLAYVAHRHACTRATMLHAARLKDDGLAFSTAAAQAKLFATDTAMRVTTDAVQVLGGVGYTEDFPVERWMREAKLLQIVEGTNQVQRMVVGRALLRP